MPSRLRLLPRHAPAGPTSVRRAAVGALLAAVVLVASGCSSGSFLGRRLDNFTAYYNTYYNARRAYDEALRTMGRTAQPVDRTRYLAVYPVVDGRSQQTALDAVIRRGADVLREHPDSKWADDALHLIGRSYFVLGQYVGAEQKFREVISLSAGGGKPSPLDSEARLWLARTLVAGGRTQAALDFLAENLAREGTSRGLAARLNLVRADLAVQRASWDDAAEALTAALDGRALRDDALRARASFLLGQVEATRGNAAAAVAAFQSAARTAGDFELAYAADVSALRLVTSGGNVEGALATLRRLERDDKYADRRAELALVRGRLLAVSGRGEEAVRAFGDALYGDHRDRAIVRGRALYGLADLYRTSFEDYAAAAVYYDSAASVLAGAPVPSGVRLTGEAITDADRRRTAFSAYASARRDIAAADSLLRLGRMDESTFAATIRGYRQRLAQEQAAAERERRRREEEAAFAGQAGGLGGTGAISAEKLEVINGGSNAGAQTQSGSTAGFLFHLDPARVRENRRAFADVWGNRPRVLNWRRREAITGTGAVQLAASEDRGAASPTGADDGLPTLDLSDIPRTRAQQDTVIARRAAARYRLGSVFLLNLEQPDSAAVYFRRVVSEDSAQRVAPRAFYALAEAQRALGDSLAAEALFRQALDRYPDLDFANRLRERFGEPLVGQVRDSLDTARLAYADALAAWQADTARVTASPPAAVDSTDALLGVSAPWNPVRGNPAPGDPQAAAQARDSTHLVRFLTLAADARGSEVGAQALYAAAVAFQRRFAGDSLSLATQPIPADTALLRRAGVVATPEALAVVAPPDVAAPVVAVPGDTTAATAPDSAATAPRVEIPAAPPLPRLADLLRALAREYPNLPYGAQGQLMLTALTTAPSPSPVSVPGGVGSQAQVPPGTPATPAGGGRRPRVREQ